MKGKTALYKKLCDGTKKFAPLLDPDKYTSSEIRRFAANCQKAKADFIFYGGSLITNPAADNFIRIIRENCEIPVLLFPGNDMHIDTEADGILLLSLISGRNPDLLIGRHVTAAPFLKNSGLEIIPTGYILVDGGKPTAVNYISNTMPVPSGKADIAMCTAMAGEMLGMKAIYMDAGSGAEQHVPAEMISRVRQNIQVPLIIGGGIKTVAQAKKVAASGADVVVVGNAIEQKPELLMKIAEGIR